MNQVLNTYGILIARYLIRATICAFVFSLVIATQPHYSYNLLSSHLLTGMSAALVLNGSWAFIELFKPSVEPIWGYYSSLATGLPLLGFVLHYVMQFLLYTLAFSLCTIGINYITNSGKHRVGIAGVGAIIISLTTTGMQYLETIPYWIISSIVLGLLLTAIWYLMFRFSYASIPVALALSFSLSIAQEMAFNLIPYVLPVGLLTIIILLGLSYYWLILCRRYQHVQS